MAATFATPHAQGSILHVHVTPGAKRTAIVGLSQTRQGSPALKIALHAKPTDGEANAALLTFLAQTLNLAKSNLTLISGHTSRHKRVLVPLKSQQLCHTITLPH